MSKTEIADKLIELRLLNKSNKLNISIDDLINRYIRRGLFMDDYYVPPELTLEELIEQGKKEVEKDKKKGIFPKKQDLDKGELIMDEIQYEIEDEKLKKLVEDKAKELNMSVGRLIWCYVNRGLMEDNIDEELFEENHSEEFLNEVNDALGID